MSQIDSIAIGTVIGADGSVYHVKIGQDVVPCTLRGRLKKERQRVTSLVSVGDVVRVERGADGGGVVSRVEPRRNKLSRPGFRDKEHVIAANVDRLLVTVSVAEPRFNRNIIDRFLLHARHGGVPPLLALTKCDLLGDYEARELMAPFEVTGVAMVACSAVTGQGIEELRRHLAGRLSVVAGQSGVGKSTLVNALVPDAAVKTQGLTAFAKGRHTTSASRTYELPGGGLLVDTPGIKSLGIWETEVEDLVDIFPEIDELASGCRFRDCAHDVEPGCAVREALDLGQLDAARYRSFLKLRPARR